MSEQQERMSVRQACEHIIDDAPLSPAAVGAYLVLPWLVLFDVLADVVEADQ